MAESKDPRRARIRWHCRRGMKELDVLFERYLSQGFDDADEQELAALEAVLAWEDPYLNAVLLGQQSAESDETAWMIERIKSFAGY